MVSVSNLLSFLNGVRKGPTEQEGAASTSTPTHQSDGAISSPVVKRRRLEGLPLFRGVDLPPNTTLAPIIRSIHVLPEEQIDDCIRNGNMHWEGIFD